VREIKVLRSRRRTATGTRSVEVVYAVTSLTYRQAHPALLAAWIQGHWAIENAVHHVRDMTPGEDSPSVRAGSGPQVMAALRNATLNLNRLAGRTNIAQAQQQASWLPGDPLKAIHTA
jgi:predicted transposase YbfD/YdcC